MSRDLNGDERRGGAEGKGENYRIQFKTRWDFLSHAAGCRLPHVLTRKNQGYISAQTEERVVSFGLLDRDDVVRKSPELGYTYEATRRPGTGDTGTGDTGVGGGDTGRDGTRKHVFFVFFVVSTRREDVDMQNLCSYT